MLQPFPGLKARFCPRRNARHTDPLDREVSEHGGTLRGHDSLSSRPKSYSPILSRLRARLRRSPNNRGQTHNQDSAAIEHLHGSTTSTRSPRALIVKRVSGMLQLGASPLSLLQRVRHSTTTPRLPTEVCERVIDFLAGGLEDSALYSGPYNAIIATLHACTVVCHAWNNRSRLYLFGTIRTRCYPGSPYDDRCTAMFLDREHHLRARVHTILAEGDYMNMMPVLNTVPLRLAAHLVGITRLRFEDAALSCVPAFFPALRQFNNVVTLALVRLVVQSISDLRRTVTSFPALLSLVISFPEPHKEFTTCVVPYSFPPCKARLKSLRIHAETAWLADPRSLYWLRWLSQSGICSDLKELYLGQMMLLEKLALVAVDDIVRASNDSLEELYLEFHPEIKIERCKQ